MEFTVIGIIDLLGTLAFSISGATLAIEKKFDLFGIYVLAFVTAIGGGTIRDVLIGNTPVEWMGDPRLIATIVVGASLTLLFNRWMKRLNYFVYLFDAVGLGLFTMVGMQKGIGMGLNIFICIVLGVISATFGGLVRDIITGEQPMLLTRKEIYALAGASGGLIYFALRYLAVPEEVNVPLCIIIVFLIRHLTYRFGIRLPSVTPEGRWKVKDN